MFDGQVGLVGDPSFNALADPDTGDPFWSPEGVEAGVEPLAPFSNLPQYAGSFGVGSIGSRGICTGASLTQVIAMPSFQQTQEPLVAEITYQARHVHGLAVGFDRAWARLRPTSPDPAGCESASNLDCEVAKEILCLGEGAYGKPPNGSQVTVRLSTSERLDDCASSEPPGEILVKRFWIRPAKDTECQNPETDQAIAFGDVVNGEANPSAGGWIFETDPEVEGSLDVNEGEEGSPGAYLERAAGATGRGTMTTQISVPLPSSMPSPALRFWWKGSSGQRFEVDAGTWVSLDDRGRRVDTLVGTGAGLPINYCLPPWTHGTVLDLSFSLTDPDTAESTELAIDAVEIFSDDDCGDGEDLLDPMFDSNNQWFGTSLGSDLQLVRTQTAGAPPLGEEGNRVLELVNGAEASMSMETYAFVPASDDQGGPALFFQVASPTQSSLRVLRGLGELVDENLETTAAWQAAKACLPPTWAERWFRVQIELGPSAPGETERVFLDDFRVDTSDECPTSE